MARFFPSRGGRRPARTATIGRAVARPTSPDAPRVLAVLLDAMDADLAGEFAREGAMPNWARLVAHAATAKIENLPGYYVGCVWPSFSTATSPARHGQYCWRQFDPETYLQGPPPYDTGDAEPFWAALDRAGRRCLVLDVPLSVRVPLAHGASVHDCLTHDPLGPGFRTWPESLRAEIPRHPEDDAL